MNYIKVCNFTEYSHGFYITFHVPSDRRDMGAALVVMECFRSPKFNTFEFKSMYNYPTNIYNLDTSYIQFLKYLFI